MNDAPSPSQEHRAPIAHPADRIATAVSEVPGVAGLNEGMFGEIGTYLPGRRVPGIRIGDDSVEVHVTLFADTPVQGAAADIRDAVANVTAGTVDVYVDDVVEP